MNGIEKNQGNWQATQESATTTGIVAAHELGCKWMVAHLNSLSIECTNIDNSRFE
jgi:hypothetical protein